MTTYNVFTKDPHATLDFGFDWSEWLDTGESIVSYVLTAGSGLSVVSSGSTSASVIAWLSSGSAGSRYPVACQITTSASRIDERTIKIDVKDR